MSKAYLKTKLVGCEQIAQVVSIYIYIFLLVDTQIRIGCGEVHAYILGDITRAQSSRGNPDTSGFHVDHDRLP